MDENSRKSEVVAGRVWHCPLIAAALAAATILVIPASAQWIGKQTGCYADSLVANPNRPTVATPADITQYGVLEIEYGWDHSWPEHDVHVTSLGGLLKFALLCDIELRWNTTSFIRVDDDGDTQQGFGDNWLGTQIRFHRQTKRVPALALNYAAKIPSANSKEGLGSGQVDHELAMLASKDICGVHFDFNASQFWIGRSEGGFERNNQLNLTFSFHLSGPLGFTSEFYGETELNRDTQGFASSLWALTYTISPRLVIDGGFEAGLTSGGPHRHVFVGATYSITNLYRALRKRSSSQSD